jgi:uncharacterized membrane protein
MITVTCAPSLQTAISALSQAAGGVVDLRLRAINDADDALGNVRQICVGLEQLARGIETELRAYPVVTGELIDPDFVLQDHLDDVIAQAVNLLASLAGKRASMNKNVHPHEQHQDLLHSALDETVDAMALLIEALKDMKAALIIHEMNAYPRNQGKTYTDVDEMLADILKT